MTGIHRNDEELFVKEKMKPILESLKSVGRQLTRRGYIVTGSIKYRPMEWSKEEGLTPVEW